MISNDAAAGPMLTSDSSARSAPTNAQIDSTAM